MIVYKLFRVRKDGSIGSLFINKKDRLELNKWLEAKENPTKGYSFRPYWHCCYEPIAPHLSIKNRAWFKVEVKNFIQMKRPKLQGSNWCLAKEIKILEKL